MLNLRELEVHVLVYICIYMYVCTVHVYDLLLSFFLPSVSFTCMYSVADLGGVRGVQLNPPFAASSVNFSRASRSALTSFCIIYMYVFLPSFCINQYAIPYFLLYYYI